MYVCMYVCIIRPSLFCHGGMKYYKLFLGRFFSSCLTNCWVPQTQRVHTVPRRGGPKAPIAGNSSACLDHCTGVLLCKMWCWSSFCLLSLCVDATVKKYRGVLEQGGYCTRTGLQEFWISFLAPPGLLVWPWANHIISVCWLISVVSCSVKQGQYCILTPVHNLSCVFVYNPVKVEAGAVSKKWSLVHNVH